MIKDLVKQKPKPEAKQKATDFEFEINNKSGVTVKVECHKEYVRITQKAPCDRENLPNAFDIKQKIHHLGEERYEVIGEVFIPTGIILDAIENEDKDFIELVENWFIASMSFIMELREKKNNKQN